MRIDHYLKAVAGFFVGGLGLLLGMLEAPDVGLADITFEQWIAVLGAAFGGLFAVYSTPWVPKEPKQTPIYIGTEADDEVLYQWQQPVNRTNTMRPEQGR